MELILFTAAHLVPCFGFVPKTVLTSKCFSYCRALLAPCFSLCALSKKAGRGQEARMGQLTPADPKGIPCHRTSHLAMKGREGGDSNVVAQELPEIPLAGGRWWMTLHHLLRCHNLNLPFFHPYVVDYFHHVQLLKRSSSTKYFASYGCTAPSTARWPRLTFQCPLITAKE